MGVAAVPGVPVSVAYGRKCLEANAHPYWIMVNNTALCGGYARCAPWWQQMVDDTLSHLDLSRVSFDNDVAVALEELAEEF